MCNGSVDVKGTPRIIDRIGIGSVPIGIESFADVSARHVYVDKTLLIANLIDRGGVTLFCRPRRFGKSLALRTLQCYFETPVEGRIESKRHLFEGTAIMDAQARHLAEQEAHPVIYLGLNICGGDDWEGMRESIAQMVSMEYARHAYLLESPLLTATEKELFERVIAASETEKELEGTLVKLATWLHRHHNQQVVILIDEYDKIVTEGYLYGFREEATRFLKRWLTGALKGTVDLRLAVLTGVQRVSKESIFSDLNNFTVDTALNHLYAESFGFTQADVEALATHLGHPEAIADAKAWYDGYNFGGEAVYNPWSVLNFFRDGCEAQPYWTNTSSNDVVRHLIARAGENVNAQLTALAEGGTVEATLNLGIVFGEIDSDTSAIWPQLYLAGYVTTDDIERPTSAKEMRRLRMPNLEVVELFQDELIDRAQAAAGSRTALEDLHNALVAGDADTLQWELEQALLNSVSYYDLQNENSCHMWMLSLMYGISGYRFPRSNREVGRGRPDIIVEPDAAHTDTLPAIVVEVKYQAAGTLEDLQSAARAALDAQALPKHYAHGLVGKGVTYLGVAFNASKQVAIALG